MQEGNVIWHKTLRMLKLHHIPAFMKTYTNFQKKLVRVFWLKYIFRIKLKIPILDLMILPKDSVPFEGLYSSNPFTFCNLYIFVCVSYQVEIKYV